MRLYVQPVTDWRGGECAGSHRKQMEGWGQAFRWRLRRQRKRIERWRGKLNGEVGVEAEDQGEGTVEWPGKGMVEAPSVTALPSSTSQYSTQNFRAPPSPTLVKHTVVHSAQLTGGQEARNDRAFRNWSFCKGFHYESALGSCGTATTMEVESAGSADRPS